MMWILRNAWLLYLESDSKEAERYRSILGTIIAGLIALLVNVMWACIG